MLRVLEKNFNTKAMSLGMIRNIKAKKQKNKNK